MMLTCTCCGRPITRATYDPAHTYRLGVYELVTLPDGSRAAARVGWCERAVCAPCVGKIRAAHTARLVARYARPAA